MLSFISEERDGIVDIYVDDLPTFVSALDPGPHCSLSYVGCCRALVHRGSALEPVNVARVKHPLRNDGVDGRGGADIISRSQIMRWRLDERQPVAPT